MESTFTCSICETDYLIGNRINMPCCGKIDSTIKYCIDCLQTIANSDIGKCPTCRKHYFFKEGNIELSISRPPPSNTFRRPLWSACHNGDIETVRLLLEQGANVNEHFAMGWTALHWCCDNNRVNEASLLLLRGALVNQRDDEGRTALHWACQLGHLDLLLLLLSHGANINEKTNDGLTPMAYASLRNTINREAVLSLLRTQGGEVDEEKIGDGEVTGGNEEDEEGGVDEEEGGVGERTKR